jgi:hypothetical protein
LNDSTSGTGRTDTRSEDMTLKSDSKSRSAVQREIEDYVQTGRLPARKVHPVDRMKLISSMPGPGGTTIEVRVAKADLCDELIRLYNTHNRALDEKAAAVLARDMRAGVFPYNGDTVRIGSDGAIEDGQHRLRAVVLFGGSMEMVFVRDLPADAQRTIDIGRKRQPGTDHTIAGRKYGLNRAAWETMLHVLEQRGQGASDMPAVHSVRMSVAERDSIQRRYCDALDWYAEQRAPNRMRIAAAGGAFAMAYRAFPAATSRLTAAVIAGSDLKAGSWELRVQKLLFALPRGVGFDTNVAMKIINAAAAIADGRRPQLLSADPDVLRRCRVRK